MFLKLKSKLVIGIFQKLNIGKFFTTTVSYYTQYMFNSTEESCSLIAAFLIFYCEHIFTQVSPTAVYLLALKTQHQLGLATRKYFILINFSFFCLKKKIVSVVGFVVTW